MHSPSGSWTTITHSQGKPGVQGVPKNVPSIEITFLLLIFGFCSLILNLTNSNTNTCCNSFKYFWRSFVNHSIQLKWIHLCGILSWRKCKPPEDNTVLHNFIFSYTYVVQKYQRENVNFIITWNKVCMKRWWGPVRTITTSCISLKKARNEVVVL